MTDEEKERERKNKIMDMIEWIDNDLLRAAKYLLFLKEENEYLKIKVIGGYQIENEELKAQIEKMKCCENCKKHRNRECSEDMKFYARTQRKCNYWECEK